MTSPLEPPKLSYYTYFQSDAKTGKILYCCLVAVTAAGTFFVMAAAGGFVIAGAFVSMGAFAIFSGGNPPQLSPPPTPPPTTQLSPPPTPPPSPRSPSPPRSLMSAASPKQRPPPPDLPPELFCSEGNKEKIIKMITYINKTTPAALIFNRQNLTKEGNLLKKEVKILAYLLNMPKIQVEGILKNRWKRKEFIGGFREEFKTYRFATDIAPHLPLFSKKMGKDLKRVSQIIQNPDWEPLFRYLYSE